MDCTGDGLQVERKRGGELNLHPHTLLYKVPAMLHIPFGWFLSDLTAFPLHLNKQNS